jgi:hypothetical protein
MGWCSSGARISTLIIDADLDMGVYDLKTDDIKEHTGAHGVDIDGVLLKDSEPYCDAIKEKSAATGVTIDGCLVKDGGAAAVVSNLSVDANLDMGAYDLKTDEIKESTGAHGVDVDGVLLKDMGFNATNYAKIASANLRNSHDAEIHDERADGSTWLLAKTFTLTRGIVGTLRFTLQAKGETVHANDKVIWAKNSKANDIGVEFLPNSTDYQANSQDVDVGTMAAGETIEVYTKAHDWQGIFVKECRISYDNSYEIAVAAPTS